MTEIIDWLIIPSLSTGGPYPQQRWSEENYADFYITL